MQLIRNWVEPKLDLIILIVFYLYSILTLNSTVGRNILLIHKQESHYSGTSGCLEMVAIWVKSEKNICYLYGQSKIFRKFYFIEFSLADTSGDDNLKSQALHSMFEVATSMKESVYSLFASAYWSKEFLASLAPVVITKDGPILPVADNKLRTELITRMHSLCRSVHKCDSVCPCRLTHYSSLVLLSNNGTFSNSAMITESPLLGNQLLRTKENKKRVAESGYILHFMFEYACILYWS